MAEALTPLPVPKESKEQSIADHLTMDNSRSNSDDYAQPELTIFKKVIESDRTIQSQQRGEPEFSESQTLAYLCSLLKTRCGNFLMRFGSLLNDADLTYIESVVKVDYEVVHRLKELRKQLGLSVKSRQKQVKNRRFQYMQHLMETSNYFSEEEMRNRNPLLYEDYIGQYLTKEETDDLDMGDRSDVTLSGLILKKMEIDKRRDLYERQQDIESGQLEESDSDDSEMDDERMDQDNDPIKVNSDQQQQLREDYLEAMQLSFLNGEDRDFNYSKIDLSDALDSIDMMGKDAEDAYFDEEEPTDHSDYEPLCNDDDFYSVL